MSTKNVTRRSLLERLAKLKRERDLDNSTAEHWNRLHPNEKPLPVRCKRVDDMIDSIEASLNNGRTPA